MNFRSFFSLKKLLLLLTLILAIGVVILALARIFDLVPRSIRDQAIGQFANYPPWARAIIRRGNETDNLSHFQSVLSRSAVDGYTPVKVLFYGQSITEGSWTKSLENLLRERYPTANFSFTNLAVGGHSSERLNKLVDADLPATLPDLVIFHVYGNHRDYEEIIKKIVSTSSASVLITSDHVTDDVELKEETKRIILMLARLPRQIREFLPTHISFTAWHNYVFLPWLGRAYGVQFSDVRSCWKKHLKTNQLSASRLLSDPVHMNQDGQNLMTACVSQSLVKATLLNSKFEPNFKEIGLPESSSNEFPTEVIGYGNRVDLISKSIDSLRSTLVNGVAPCSLPGATRLGRASPVPGSSYPALLQVIDQRPADKPATELLTVNLLSGSSKLGFTFELISSVLGSEGVGISTKDFMSKNGTISIKADSWNIFYAESVSGKTIDLPHAITITSRCPFTKPVLGAGVGSVSRTGLFQTTLVSGITSGSQIVRLRSESENKAIRFYYPSLKTDRSFLDLKFMNELAL